MQKSTPKRIMVIGNCGSGKSTLAKKISKITGIELYHLDQYYWKSNWTQTPENEWEQIVQKLADKESWVIDGNYGGTIDIRFARADTVVFLDVGRWTCLYRVITRTIRNYGKTRSDLANSCPEEFDWQFLKYVYHFPNKKRPNLLLKLRAIEKEKEIYTLTSSKETKAFLDNL